ncbi:Hypothetical protein D9617_60g048150 [Elsinoe fawcettii]|nr:Hypothetical protein D9617_60g048150 [Elsinoe fawcettii]
MHDANKATKSADDDVAAVRDLILSVLSRGEDVLVVAHSYGTIPGMSSLTSLDPTSRKAAGHSNAVVGIVIISGVVLKPGISQYEQMGAAIPPFMVVEDGLTHIRGEPSAHQLFYGDLTEEESKPYVDMLVGQSYHASQQPLPDQMGPCKDASVTYLFTKQDVVLPFALQQMFVSAIREGGVTVYTEEADTAHSPFLSQPEATAKFIRSRAGEEGVVSEFNVLGTE